MRRAFLGGTPPLAYVSAAFDASSGVLVGTNWGGTLTWSGGTAPYSVALLATGAVQYQTTGISATTYTLRGAALQVWNNSSMNLRVTDSTGASVMSPSRAISVYWITTPTVTPSSTSPPVGQIIILTASVSSGNPTSYAYAWEYKQGGGEWTAFAGNVASAPTGAFTTAGVAWLFRCTVSSAAGSLTGYSSTVTPV